MLQTELIHISVGLIKDSVTSHGKKNLFSLQISATSTDY